MSCQTPFEGIDLSGRTIADVWFFLAHVKALPGNAMRYVPGSIIFMQCFIPEHRIETALVSLDSFLETEKFSRFDLSIARRYESSETDVEYSTADVERRVKKAAQAGQPDFGMCFSGEDTSAFEDEPTQPGRPN